MQVASVPTGNSRISHSSQLYACGSEVRRHSGRAVLNVAAAGFTVAERQWGRTVGQKDIIKDISVSVRSGETLAVMGPSGAGKTTFMDLLTLEGSCGRRTGYVNVNGEPITQELFKRCCSYVPQCDQGWAFLTCRESLQFAADFYVTTDNATRSRRVEELLERMGLESCADTKVGNEFLKGLSGGQRRRLSLAVAFLKDPLVLFLDEITSGLDAASAAGIASFLQGLARTQDVVIVCTIHQPSAKVFSGFDKLLLLSGGREAYSGEVKGAAEHFGSLGLEIPAMENPADFFLDSVNADFTDKERVESVLEAWATRPLEVCGTGSLLLDPIEKRTTRSRFVEVAVLFRRMLVLAARDPTVYISRIAVFVCACTFFSVVYIKSWSRTQDQVLPRFWLLIWHMGVPAMMSMAACLGQNIEFASVRREVRAGMYNMSSYLAAQHLVQIPFMLILSLSSIGFSGYVLSNWNSEGFLQVLLVHALLLFSFECAAQLFAVSFANPLLGLFQVVSFWFASFLFGGFLVPEDDVPMPLRLFAYVSPMKWASKAVAYAEFHGSTFDGAVLDPNSPHGFSCPSGGVERECFGATGDQVLTTLRLTIMKHLSSEPELAADCVVLVAIAVAFRFLYFVVAMGRCRSGQPVRAPAREGAGSATPLPQRAFPPTDEQMQDVDV